MSDTIIVLCIIGAICFGVNSCESTDWYKAREEVRVKEERQAEVPHKIRSADGCDVYAFRASGNEHFFTRCALKATTERNYTMACGKNQQCPHKEIITTENK